MTNCTLLCDCHISGKPCLMKQTPNAGKHLSQEPFAVDTNGREYSLDDITTILHILRNPAGWSEETVREVRLKAADIIEGM